MELPDHMSLDYLFLKYFLVFVVVGNIMGATYWIRRWKKDKNK